MEREDRAAWGPLIGRYRGLLGLTQQDLADRAKVSLKSIGNYESGATVPQSAKLMRLLDALELSSDIRVARSQLAELESRRDGDARRAAPSRLDAFMAEIERTIRSMTPDERIDLIQRIATAGAIADSPVVHEGVGETIKLPQRVGRGSGSTGRRTERD